jgi:hypothetical protein
MRWWLSVLAMLSILPAQAQNPPDPFNFGENFMPTCEKPVNNTILIGCSAYTRGLRDMAFILRTMGSLKDVGECQAAQGLAGADVLGILVDYLRANPEYAAPGSRWETAGLYWFALSAKYSCWAPAAGVPKQPPADKRF